MRESCRNIKSRWYEGIKVISNKKQDTFWCQFKCHIPSIDQMKDGNHDRCVGVTGLGIWIRDK